MTIDADGMALLGELEAAAPSRQDEILKLLEDRASASSALPDWIAVADGLSLAGRYVDAIDLRQQLLTAVAGPSDPQWETIRFGLAVDYLNSQSIDLALQEFGRVAGQAASRSIRERAAEQVQLIEAWRAQVTADLGWQRLKASAMEERVGRGVATDVDHEQLARALLKLSHAGDGDVTPPMIEAALARAVAAFPEDPALWEMRVVALLRDGPDEALDAALEALERVNPDSTVLRELAFQPDSVVDRHRDDLWQQVQNLLNDAMSGDEALSEGAEADLRTLLAKYPRNTNVRVAYAFGLEARGKFPEALVQAGLLAEGAGQSHPLHLSLAQLFWRSGDQERGRHHLALAEQFASGDDDRADVASVRSILEGP